MVDTRRTLSAINTLYADNTAGDIGAQDARDMIKSVYGAGLETNAQTVTTTDITGAVGQLYVCTIAGLTANRNLTLPSAAVDELVGVQIVDGDASFALILKGAASQTINGGSAATEWSRLFIAGETVIFRCTAANTWVVANDGRKPCRTGMLLNGDITTLTPATWEAVVFNSKDITDTGGIADSTAGTFVLRRAGTYLLMGQIQVDNLATDKFCKMAFFTSGAFATKRADGASHRNESTSTLGVVAISPANLITIAAAGDTVYPAGYVTGTGDHTISGSGDGETYMDITEIL